MSPVVGIQRVMSISQLLYPRVNPQFHFIPAMGLALTGVLLLPFAGYVRRRLGIDSPAVRAGAAFFAGGAVCLILASLITSHPLHGRATVPKLHEVLGRAAGVGLGAGILLFEFYALRQRHRAGSDLVSRRLVFWWSLITWSAIVLLILRLIIEVHFQVLNPFTRTLKNRGMASGVLGMDWISGRDCVPGCFGVASARDRSGWRCVASGVCLRRPRPFNSWNYPLSLRAGYGTSRTR